MTSLTFTEDVGRRFEAYGWQVLRVARRQRSRGDRHRRGSRTPGPRRHGPHRDPAPTHIGDPAPTKRDTAEAHGAPLGTDEVARTKAIMGWPETPFYVPAEAAEMAGPLPRASGAEPQRRGRSSSTAFGPATPADAAELDAWLAGAVAGRMGCGPARVHAGRWPARDPTGLGQGAERARCRCPT